MSQNDKSVARLIRARGGYGAADDNLSFAEDQSAKTGKFAALRSVCKFADLSANLFVPLGMFATRAAMLARRLIFIIL